MRRSEKRAIAQRTSAPGRQAAGTVVWFNNEKGFGFIRPDGETGERGTVFVHFSEICMEGHKYLLERQAVTFTLVQTDKGLSAKDVVPILM